MGNKDVELQKSHLKQHGLLLNPSQKGVDEKHHLHFTVPRAHILSNR
jgi:hypothetical protein